MSPIVEVQLEADKILARVNKKTLVLINLAGQNPQGGSSPINESVTLGDLGVDVKKAQDVQAEEPVMPLEELAAIRDNPDLTPQEKAEQAGLLMGGFRDAAQDHQKANKLSLTDQIAAAVVKWLEKTRDFNKNPNGYQIATRQVNVTPVIRKGDVFYNVTGLAQWGGKRARPVRRNQESKKAYIARLEQYIDGMPG